MLEKEFPDFYRSTDRFSLDGQNRYTKGTRLQLIALVLAAIAGGFTVRLAVGGADWAGIVAAVAFGAAALQRGQLWRDRPDKDWYAGRAAAESTKTLAWRFVSGADPFSVSVSVDDALQTFLVRLVDIRAKVQSLVVVPSIAPKGEVTEAMIRMRASSLSLRKDAYLNQRVLAQQQWYASKAILNRRRLRAWSAVMLALEVLGLGGAILKASGVLDLDSLGIASAFVAAIAAWSEMRQYGNLASAYSVTAHELNDVIALGSTVETELGWSQFVVDAEEAISREHTMWVASREA